MLLKNCCLVDGMDGDTVTSVVADYVNDDKMMLLH